jgi:hypothetical protein
MLKRLIFVGLILCISIGLSAQEKKRKAYKPDIPGFFLIDFGLNSGFGTPQYFTKGFWGSRTLNLYYHYPLQLGNSKFSYNPGTGFSFERFKLTNDYTLAQQVDASGYFDLISINQGLQPSTIFANAGIRKSMIVTNYFDVMPLEFRFDANPKDRSRGFNVSIGGRVSVLMESHTKVKYTANGLNGIFKDKQLHGLNQFRYGIYTRVGIGNFNFFGFYNLSPYFAPNRGPAATNMNTMTIGISLNGL